MSFFPQIIAGVIKHEGTAWVLDNNGYYVKFGLNQASFPEVREDTTLDEAVHLYYTRLWKPKGMDEIRDPQKAYIVFDTIVQHSGHAKIIQRAINSITPGRVVEDNKWGPKTRQAINEAPLSIVPEIAIERWYYVNYDPATRKSNLEKWLGGIKKRYSTWATPEQLDEGARKKAKARGTYRETLPNSGSSVSKNLVPALIFAGVGFLLFLSLH